MRERRLSSRCRRRWRYPLEVSRVATRSHALRRRRSRIRIRSLPLLLRLRPRRRGTRWSIDRITRRRRWSRRNPTWRRLRLGWLVVELSRRL